ncbi:MAG: ATP-binding cassette domain-containing protein [Lachnospiraceae bacterium]|nr:ATP-binding cassette domain-containing protein [Lachnospiraceae bacterium]
MSLFVDIEKSFGDFCLKVQFNTQKEVFSLLGASGCGKSLSLKCIAGIEKPDRGRILLDDKVLFDSEKHINLPPGKRGVGYLFQSYALFPNMNVYKNLREGLKDKKQIEKIYEMLEKFGIEDCKDKFPRQLSGGQKQRVALARILLNEPDVLLLDEPFSALDSHIRFKLEQNLRKVLSSLNKSVILVSHDRDEVFRLSQTIAIMGRGSIDCIGKKEDVFKRPLTKNAAILTGCKNISPVEKVDEHRLFAKDWGITLFVDAIPKDTNYIGVRMHYIKDAALETSGDAENIFDAELTEEIENPFSYTLMLKPKGTGCLTNIGWELGKDSRKGLDDSNLKIEIPKEAILFLK